MRRAKFGRTLDEFLAGHREEFDLVLGGVGIEERRLAAIDGVAERCVFCNQVLVPGVDGPRPAAGRTLPRSLGSARRERNVSPVIDAVAPVDEYATAVCTPPPAVRALRSRRTTLGSPNAAATLAWVRTRGTHEDHGTLGSMLQWSSVDTA